MRLRAFVALSMTAFTVAGATASAASTYYASPDGDGAFPCTRADPCSLLDAVQNSSTNDEIVILPGYYDVGTNGINLYHAQNMHGVPRGHSVIHSMAGTAVYMQTGGRLADLRIDDPAGEGVNTAFGSSTLERLRVLASSTGAACQAPIGGVLRDSVCINEGTGRGVGMSGYAGGPLTWSSKVINVTAYAAGSGPGISFESSGQLSMSARVINTIAHGGGATADIETSNTGTGEVTLNLKNSNYDSASSSAGSSIVEAGGNQLMPPSFIDETGLDLHERGSSSTVNTGTTSASRLGKLDVDRQPRVQGGAPDIGADEFDHSLLLKVDAKKHQPPQKLEVEVSCPREECTAFAKGRAKARGHRFQLETTDHQFLARGEHEVLQLRAKHLGRLERLVAAGGGTATITVKGIDAGGVRKQKRRRVELI